MIERQLLAHFCLTTWTGVLEQVSNDTAEIAKNELYFIFRESVFPFEN